MKEHCLVLPKDGYAVQSKTLHVMLNSSPRISLTSCHAPLDGAIYPTSNPQPQKMKIIKENCHCVIYPNYEAEHAAVT